MVIYPDSRLDIIRDHLIDNVLSVQTQRSLCKHLPELLYQATEEGRNPTVVSMEGFKDNLEIVFEEMGEVDAESLDGAEPIEDTEKTAAA